MPVIDKFRNRNLVLKEDRKEGKKNKEETTENREVGHKQSKENKLRKSGIKVIIAYKDVSH